ncbi:MBL fold metallo-hydrolase [Pectinatus cerevisiiphilus]|uniref:Glyoxylase-like metal-dependent hydrolase (Beta-lactamase superfamily II) n=1 Tax=Pectinatus cerevisiiphilus TaxID=86956 RepID=A0A4R3K2L9_9FIRM|nr:MBL fold metallo-hydrolase [Pectinatus cerevisiiphilus]TCS76671.1 glyoxylase-like metal-dependent hydrolase (beta-lactamase superfamily II) [Pectinatus cerevisiiphilus]
MKVKVFTNGSFEENCYLAIDEPTGEALIIDPGSQPKSIIQWVKEEKCKVKYVINTHGHSDHIGANTEVCNEFGVKLGIHPLDAPMLTDTKLNLSAYWGEPILSKKADFFLNENDIVKCGDSELRVVHTPGHTPGGICLVGEKIIFSGDSLFADSIGRTDFPGGSTAALIKSLKEKILPLAGSIIVYPGHGPTTTIDHERTYNPYFC